MLIICLVNLSYNRFMSIEKNSHLAVFGGSFDPFHQGHQTIIDEALKTLDISALILVPTYLNPFKQSFSKSPSERLKALQQIKFDTRVTITDFEIQQNQPTPTIKTIEHFMKMYQPTKIYLIIGADNLAKLSTWSEYEKLKELVEFVVATRDNIVIPPHYKVLDVKEDISSTALRSKEAQSLEPK